MSYWIRPKEKDDLAAGKGSGEAGGKAMDNEELLEEVVISGGIPYRFYGEFSPSYLDVPPEVLTTSMIEHQRYFPVYNNEGRLARFCRSEERTNCLDLVRAGNERVLKARLEDALFSGRKIAGNPWRK